MKPQTTTIGDEPLLIELDIDPVPASRPRVTRYATYYAKRYQNFRELMAEHMRHWKNTPIEGNLTAVVTFFVPLPTSYTKKKKTSLTGQFCGNNCDIDNYLKAFFDGLNEKVIKDDSQIVSVQAEKRWSETGRIRCILRNA